MLHTRTSLLISLLGGMLLLSACAEGGSSSPPPAATAESGPQVIGADQAVALLEQRDEATVIDVRTPAEYADGHLTDALLLDIQGASFDADLDELDREGTYVVYCRTGNRSATAVERMAVMGFTEVYDAGGYDELAEAGAPVVN